MVPRLDNRPGMSIAQKREIAWKYASGKYTYADLARQHGVSVTLVGLVVKEFLTPADRRRVQTARRREKRARQRAAVRGYWKTKAEAGEEPPTFKALAREFGIPPNIISRFLRELPRQCSSCGRAFHPASPGEKYCSERCRAAKIREIVRWQTRQRSGYPRGTPPWKTVLETIVHKFGFQAVTCAFLSDLVERYARDDGFAFHGVQIDYRKSVWTLVYCALKLFYIPGPRYGEFENAAGFRVYRPRSAVFRRAWEFVRRFSRETKKK